MGRRAEDSPDASAFGLNVRRRRRAIRWSESDLASKAGLSRSTVSAVERGKYKSFDMSTAKKLAQALGTTVDDLNHPSLVAGPPTAEIVEAFLSSSWGAAIIPTEEEIAWIRSLPSMIYEGMAPGPETIGELIRWRRKAPRK
jgi:transcriptional regulator with XRE-family HTH domain